MTLFINKTADELLVKINELVDNFSMKMKSYKSIDTKIDNRSELSNNLILISFLTGMATVPTGMMLGKLYLENIGAGGALGAILPVGLGVGAGVLSYLNHRTKERLETHQNLEKSLQSKHNEKHGNEFLKKLEVLEIGSTFDKVKNIVDESIKHPPAHQSNVLKEVKKALKNSKLR